MYKIKPYSEKVNWPAEKRKNLREAKISWKIYKVISDDKEVAETLHRFSCEHTCQSYNFSQRKVGNDNEHNLDYINKFWNDSRVKFLKPREGGQNVTFYYTFQPTNCNNAAKWDSNKFLQENSEVFFKYFYKIIIFYIDNSAFSSDLKHADVTPAFKKKPKISKENYRPISILPNV